MKSDTPSTANVPKKRKPSKRDLEDKLSNQIKEAGLPQPEREYRFAKADTGRLWRADFCWPERRLIVEVEGGVFVGGRHTTGAGFTNDCQKYAEAAILGWYVIRVTSPMIRDKSAVSLISRFMDCGLAA